MLVLRHHRTRIVVDKFFNARFIRIAVAAMCAALLQPPLIAQLSGATLTGQVADLQRAAVPGATVVLRNNATGVSRTEKSNSAGLYTFADVDPGVYSVTVTSAGFANFVEENVQLNVGTTRNLDIPLQIGAVTENVTVTADNADVETDTSLVSATVGEKRIVELPLNGRDWTQLATLQPGVNNVRTQALTTAISSNRATRGYGNSLTANGHSPYENAYRVDGINENDYSNGAPGSPAGVNLGVDAIQEFSVVTTAYTAEYGRTSGAVVNAVTRSGNNDLHGSLYFFDRDKIFDAKNPFDSPTLPIPSFHRGQFGIALGGPLKRDKTFLFGNYEGLRQAQSLNENLTVPSAAARAGNVHSTTGASQTISVSPSIAPYLALYPLPNGTLGSFGDTGVYSHTGLVTVSEDFATARLDENFSQKDTVSFTFVYDNAPSTLPDVYNNVLNENFDQRELGAINERHLFGPNLLNVLRLGYNRNSETALVPIGVLNPAAADPTLGYQAGLFAPQISITGITTGGGSGASRQSIIYYNSYQLNDDIAWQRGRHAFKFGFAGERITLSGTNPVKNGTATFITTGTTTALTNFLTDRPYSVQIPPPTIIPLELATTLLAGYVQDDWRVRPRLTLNLGLRYEWTTIPYDRRNRAGAINTLSAPAGTGPCPANVVLTSIPGCTVPIPAFLQSNPTNRDFEPRVGFAYDVFGNGRTAFRGAFGIYDLLPYPFLFVYSAIGSPYEADSTATGNVPAGAFPNGIVSFINSQPQHHVGNYFDPHPHRDYSMNYNLNIEQQFSKTISGSIGYVGFHGVHNPFETNEANIVSPSQVQVVDGRYIFPATGNAAQDQNAGEVFGHFWDGSQHYSGLLTQLKVSGYHGLVSQATYTWQKCIDYGPTQSPATYTNTVTALVYYDKAQRRGACDYVLAQNFAENTIYRIPGPDHGAAQAIFGGFEVAGIVNVSTGSPFTLLNSGDVLGEKGVASSAFPDFQQGCNPYNPSYKTSGRIYVNANCFSYPTVAPGSDIARYCRANPTPLTNGQILCMNLQGNERRGQLIGPRLVNADASLIKNTSLPRLGEAANLQLRFEAFNIFNHSNFQAPTDNLTLGGRASAVTSGVAQGTAGILTTTATSSRQIQIGARITF